MIDSCIRLILDVRENSHPETVRAKRGDTGRILRISLSDGGVPYIITPDCYAVFTARKPDGTALYNHCALEKNEILYGFTEQTCSAVGRMQAEIRLYGGDHKLLTSAVFVLEVRDTVWHEGDVESTDEMNALEALILETAALKSEVQHKLENGEFQGLQGEQGPPGPRGPKGEDGSIVFEELTPEQMELLRGPEGQPGKDGQDGHTPKKGIDYFDGQDGKAGNGIKSAVLNADDTLTLTFDNGTKYTTPSIRGQKGDDGYTPQKNVDYFDGKDGQDGKDGNDGVSPTVAVSKSGKVTTISITDKNGTKNATVNDGADGQPGKDGQNGDIGRRGTGLLPITTAPSSYTTAVIGLTPAYRIALSTVKAQASTDAVYAGDTVRYSYYHYPVIYVDSSYVYCGARVSIRGATGAAYTLTEADKNTIAAAVKDSLPTLTVTGIDADGVSHSWTMYGVAK